MTGLGMDPGGKFGFEASMNSNLRMSQAAMASVKFKLDKEKAKYEKTIRVLNLSEKVEMRIAQKQVEDVKKELTLMRAYQQVAKQMAFKNFDPVIRRRRERREKERQEEREAETKRREQELQQLNNDVDNYIDEEDGDVNINRVPEQDRRMSSNGNVFVTLQDIMGNDEVLRRNSRVIHEQRRKSQASLEFWDCKDDSLLSGRRRKSDASFPGKLRSPRRGSMASVSSSVDGEIVTDSNNTQDVVDGKVETPTGHLLDAEMTIAQRRRSRVGSLGTVGLHSIEENGAEGEKERDTQLNNGFPKETRGDSSKGNRPSSLVVSGRKGFKTTGNLVKGFFLTSTDENEMSDKKSKRNRNGIDDKRDKPMSIYQISKFYEKQNSKHMEESKTKEINQQKRLERRKYESLRRKLQKEKFDKENRNSRKNSDATKAVSAPEKRSTEFSEDQNNSPPEKTSSALTTASNIIKLISKNVQPLEEPKTEPDTADSPSEKTESEPISPLKGLARFKNAATAVSVQLTVANPNKNKTNRLKNIAAAVMMKESPAVGQVRVPKAFMYSDTFADRFGREREKCQATALEASHRKPEDAKIRPLAMPESVKAEYTEKWKSLMGNVNSAVHWKVRALREDTGTVNSRQLRRQAREEQPSVIPVSPRSPRNPPRSVFPGACKTTWAVKRFVSKEIEGVLKAWQPDNVRRKRNQKMKSKVSFPDFIDRIRTTNSILKSFRSYCKERQEKNEEDEDCDNGDDKDDKDDDGNDTGDAAVASLSDDSDTDVEQEILV